MPRTVAQTPLLAPTRCAALLLLTALCPLPATAHSRTFHLHLDSVCTAPSVAPSSLAAGCQPASDRWPLMPPRAVLGLGEAATGTTTDASFASALERPSGLLASREEPLLDLDRESDDVPLAGPPDHALPLRVLLDIKDLLRAPATMSGRQWAKLGGGLLLVGAVSLADEDVRDFAQRQSDGPDSTFIDAERPLSNGAGLLLLGTGWFAGHHLHKPHLQAMAADGLEASVIAGGLITPVIKKIVGRERPRSGFGPHAFEGGHSFPSGEATEAFAIASVVTAHYRQRWIRTLAWGLAGISGWGRIRVDGHWASDVVGGALVGSAVGRWVVHRNRPELLHSGPERHRRHWSIAPTVDAENRGLAFNMAW